MASLFSGFAGLDAGIEMGLEETGLEVEHVAFCEHFESTPPHKDDDYPRRLLQKRFPGVPLLGDVSTIDGAELGAHDILVGGFPCTDISAAKKDAQGLAGSRSGLWFQQLRIIRECESPFLVIENVANLRSRGLWAVLAGLWESGYAAQYDILSARSVGAPHLRERCFILATRLDLYEGPLDFVSAMPEVSAWEGWWPLPWREGEKPKTDKPRIRGLGNAVVPQVAAVIGRALGRGTLAELPPLGRRQKERPLYRLAPEVRLPRAGCIDLDTGYVVELACAAPPDRKACRYLLPTPTATSYRTNSGGENPGHKRPSLEVLAREGRIPTPTANLERAGGFTRQRDGRSEEISLKALVKDAYWSELEQRMAEGTVPTPTSASRATYHRRVRDDGTVDIYPSLPGLVAKMAAGAVLTPQTRDWKGPVGRGSQASGGRMSSLPSLIHEELRAQRELEHEQLVEHLDDSTVPTPTSSDSKGGPRRGGRFDKQLRFALGGSLNPEFVEWLMGMPLQWTDVDYDPEAE